MPDNAKVALVIGAGDATGGAVARRFAREGFIACVTRRNADKLAPLVAQIESEGGKARAFGSDARKEIEEMGGRPVFLELRVKVLKDWRNNEDALRRLGYKIDRKKKKKRASR